MFGNLLCKNDCTQSTVYLVAQSVWILLYAGFIVSLIQKNMIGTQVLMPLVIMIVITAVLYHLINYLCKNDHGNIAWFVALLPYISAIVWGYHIIPLLMNCMAKDRMQGLNL